MLNCGSSDAATHEGQLPRPNLRMRELYLVLRGLCIEERREQARVVANEAFGWSASLFTTVLWWGRGAERRCGAVGMRSGSSTKEDAMIEMFRTRRSSRLASVPLLPKVSSKKEHVRNPES